MGRVALWTSFLATGLGLFAGCGGDDGEGANGGSGAEAGSGASTTGGNSGSGGDATGGSGDATGSGGSSAAAGSSASGGLSGGGPIGPRPDGCTTPPELSSNPTAGYDWDAPTPTVVVTSADDSGAGTLREALANASDGDVIGFDPSLANATISLSEQLVVAASITLDGSAAPGITLDGQGSSRVISTNKNLDSVLVGLRIVNGNTDGNGGGVEVRQVDEGQGERSVEVIGCHFENNVGVAGALFIGWRVNAVVRDSVFTGNQGPMGAENKCGGAISTRQDASEGLLVQRCRFERNWGSTSGAIYNILQPIVVEDSVFIDNTSDGSGAIFTDGGNTVGPSNDPATGEEGWMIIRRVWIQGSTGVSEGGAILLWGYPRDITLIESTVVIDSVVEPSDTGNSKGGAARLHALDDLVIRDSTFANNRSTQQGGALWIDGTGNVEMSNTLFSGNRVEDDQGGAFTYNGRDTVFTINGCGFVDNYAGRASGALWWASGDQDITVSNSYFVNNDAPAINDRHTRMPAPADGGGNLEWVTDQPDRGRVFPNGVFADPGLGDLATVNGMLVRPFTTDSPLGGGATSSAPERDARGAPRDASPDIGPYELDAVCE